MTAPSLTDFLLARIAEDEEAVRVEVEVHRELGFTDEQIDSHSGPGDWGPARVLSECGIRRDIVGLYGTIQLGEGVDGYPVPLGGAGPETYWDVLCLLALPYDDHPDYQPEWRA